MRGKRANMFLVVAAIAVAVVAAPIFFRQPIARFSQNLVGEETVSCAELPAAATAQGREGDLDAFGKQVAEVTRGRSFVHFDFERCPGRVEIFIGYGGEGDKATLLKLWQNSKVSDIPVHWRNV